IEGGAVDARADVYSLAAMLVVALTGEPAFDGTTVAKLYAHVNADPPRIGAQRADLAPFDEVIARGMAKLPDDRYASAGDLTRSRPRPRRTMRPVPRIRSRPPSSTLRRPSRSRRPSRRCALRSHGLRRVRPRRARTPRPRSAHARRPAPRCRRRSSARRPAAV